MECHCIPTRDLPHTSKLLAAFLDDFRSVSEYYAQPPTLDGALAAARSVNLDASVRRQVVEILRDQNRSFGSGAETARNLDRLASGAVALVTCQQVALFGGPAFTLYKTLTAVALAKELTARGVDAVPIFWPATEDHDFAEINHAYLLDSAAEDGLRRLELPPSGSPDRPAGPIGLGQGVSQLVSDFSALLEGPGAKEVGDAVAAAYAPQETFGSAFAKLFAALLKSRGVILFDPRDPRLHSLARPVFARALDEHTELAKALLARGRELTRRGFHAQVKVTESGTLLFLEVDGRRLPLRAREGGFAAGNARFTSGEITAHLEALPELFSAGALLRPVYQDFLLPTALLIGGPAEVAYFAQSEVLYRHLLGRRPAVLLRAGFTLVEPAVARLLKKYALEVSDVWRGRQALRARLEAAFLPKGLAAKFARGEKALRSLLAQFRTPIEKLDRTLRGSLDTAEKKMLYQYAKLQSKAGRAENFRTGVLDRHERALVSTLFPRHALQERTLSLLPLLAAYGLELLDELERRAASGGSQHQLIFL